MNFVAYNLNYVNSNKNLFLKQKLFCAFTDILLGTFQIEVFGRAMEDHDYARMSESDRETAQDRVAEIMIRRLHERYARTRWTKANKLMYQT